VTRRYVQRTPDLRVAIRMQRPEGGACQTALPEGGGGSEPPGLGWWDQDAGTWTRVAEAQVVSPSEWEVDPWQPPCLLARLVGAGDVVEWVLSWNDEPYAIDDHYATHYGAPDVTVSGAVLAAYRYRESPWGAQAGVLEIRAVAGGVEYGPIILVVTIAGY
jgi:hypothetical protein